MRSVERVHICSPPPMQTIQNCKHNKNPSISHLDSANLLTNTFHDAHKLLTRSKFSDSCEMILSSLVLVHWRCWWWCFFSDWWFVRCTNCECCWLIWFWFRKHTQMIYQMIYYNFYCAPCKMSQFMLAWSWISFLFHFVSSHHLQLLQLRASRS